MSAINKALRSPYLSAAPFLLAYVLGGAKPSTQFCWVFLVIAGLYFWSKERSPELPSSQVVPAVILVFIAASFARSLYPSLSFTPIFESAKWCSYVLFFIVMFRVKKNGRYDFFPFLIVVCALFESAYLLIHYRSDAAMGGYLKGNPGYSAILIGGGILFSLSFLMEKVGVGKRVIFSVMGAFLFLALLLTHSRAAILGTLLGAVFVIPRKYRFGYGVGLMGGFAIVLRYHFDWLKIDPDHVAHTYGRLVIWKTGIIAIKGNWLFGYGPGNFELAYWQNAQPSGDILRYGASTKFAHNDLLQLLIETGLVGTGLFLFFVWEFMKEALKERNNGWVERGGVAVLFLFAVYSSFAFSFYNPVTGLLASGCAALLWKNGRVDNRLHFAFGVFAIIYAVLLFMPKKIFTDTGDPFAWSRLARELSAQKETQPDDVLKAFYEAKKLSPKHAPFWCDEGFYRLQLKDWAAAKAQFKTAIKLEPETALPYFGLGIALAEEGDNVAAVKLIRKAIAFQARNAGRVEKSPYADYLFSIDVTRAGLLVEKIRNSSIIRPAK